jgi:uncharacterized membrane protein
VRNPEQRWEHQLRRIETLTDVVFAVILVRTFVLLPKPSAAERSAGDMLDFYVENLGAFAMVLIGFLITIIYWVQSNATFGLLRRTDTRHTIFSLVQLVALLLFMYAIRMGIDYDGDTFAMVFESSTAALMGFLGWANWSYATRDRKLMHDWVTDDEILKCSLRLIPEPVTAVLTIPCAFIHPGLWGLSWFVVAPVVSRITKRKLSS